MFVLSILKLTLSVVKIIIGVIIANHIINFVEYSTYFKNRNKNCKKQDDQFYQYLNKSIQLLLAKHNILNSSNPQKNGFQIKELYINNIDFLQKQKINKEIRHFQQDLLLKVDSQIEIEYRIFQKIPVNILIKQLLIETQLDNRVKNLELPDIQSNKIHVNNVYVDFSFSFNGYLKIFNSNSLQLLIKLFEIAAFNLIQKKTRLLIIDNNCQFLIDVINDQIKQNEIKKLSIKKQQQNVQSARQTNQVDEDSNQSS